MRKHYLKMTGLMLITLCLAWSGYALPEYTIDFKIGARAGRGEHGLIYTGIEQKSIEDGLLKLEIGPENKDAKISVERPRGVNISVRAYFPQTGKLYEHARVMIKLRALGTGFPPEGKYDLRFLAKTDKGEVNLAVPVTDLSGAGFHEYTLDLESQPAWKNAGVVQDISFLLYPTNTFSKLVLEIEHIKFIPPIKRVVDDKLAQVDETKIEYLDKCVPALARQGLTIKGLEDQIAQFKEIISKAKEHHQANDYEQAYARIKEAEELHNRFYPRINMGWELVDLKGRIEGLDRISEIYRKKGARQTPDISNIKNSYETCAKSLAASGAIAPQEIQNLTAQVDAAYQRLDRVSPYGAPMRPGLSETSFGRFGWLPADFSEGLLVYNLTEYPNILGKDFDNNTKVILTSESFQKLLDPVVGEEKKDVNWVSYRRNIVFRTADKNKEVHWDYICSLLAPGILLNTDAENLLLGQSRRKSMAPTHVVIPSADGCAAKEITEAGIVPQMSENWLLFLWKGIEKHNPVLLVFEKKPDSVKLAKNYASITRGGGLGHVGVADYAGMIPLDPKTSEAWVSSVPEDVIKKCRLLARVMTHYPVKCREYYGVDEAKREILIRNEIEYYSINDEWQTPHEAYAPIPPMASYFKDIKYPITVKQEEIDFDIATKYGPYRAVRGEELEYTIPLPDFNHHCYLRSEGDAATDKRAGAVESPSVYFAALPTWNLLNPESRENHVLMQREKMELECHRTLKYSSQYGITEGLPDEGKEPYFRGPGAHSTTVDRIEPYSGLYYVATGWHRKYKGRVSTAPRTYGDFANGLGIMVFEPYYYYAKYSGDWEYIKECWPFIKKLFLVYGRVNDWANWAIDYQETRADNYVDMGPDVFKGPVSFMKLAQAVNDREAYLWGAYVAAKQSVNRMTFFTLGDYMQKYSDIAQAGDYCLDLGVGEFGCDIKDYANMPWQSIVNGFNGKTDNYIHYALFQNMWTGCDVFLEDYDLCRQCVPDSMGKIAFEDIPRHIPDWWCAYHGLHISRYMLARAMLDESSEDLWLYFDELAARPGRCHLGGHLFILFTTLQGRDAPVYLIDWEPNKLVQGTYDYKNNIARIEVECVAKPAALQGAQSPDWKQRLAKAISRMAFWRRQVVEDAEKESIVKLKSYVRPAQVTCNGQEDTSWEYDPQRQELTLEIKEPGLHKLAISYPGWKKPLRKSYPGIEKLRDTAAGKTQKMPPTEPIKKGLTFYANFDDTNHPVVFARGRGDLMYSRDLRSWGAISSDEGVKGKGLGATLKPGGQMAECHGEHNVPVRDGTVSFWIRPQFGTEDMEKVWKALESAMKEHGIPASTWHCLDLRLLEALPAGAARNLHHLIWSYAIGRGGCNFTHYITSWATPRWGGSNIVEISTPYQKGEWTHLATSWTTAPDGKSLTFNLYKNGKPEGTKTAVCDNPASLEQVQKLQEQGFPSLLTMLKYVHYPWIDPVELIKKNPRGLPDLRCAMDELRMYDRGLDAKEIKTLYEFDRPKVAAGKNENQPAEIKK